MLEIPATKARAELAELLTRVAYAGERVTLTRHGKPLGALVSIADLHRLEELDRQPDAGRPGLGFTRATATPEPQHGLDTAAHHPSSAVDPRHNPPRA